MRVAMMADRLVGKKADLMVGWWVERRAVS